MKLLEKTGLNRINVDRKKICLFMIYALAALTVFLSIIPNKQDVIIAIAFVLLNTFKIIVFVFIILPLDFFGLSTLFSSLYYINFNM